MEDSCLPTTFLHVCQNWILILDHTRLGTKPPDRDKKNMWFFVAGVFVKWIWSHWRRGNKLVHLFWGYGDSAQAAFQFLSFHSMLHIYYWGEAQWSNPGNFQLLTISANSLNFWHVLTLNVVDIHQIMIISFSLTPFDHLNFQNTKIIFFAFLGYQKVPKRVLVKSKIWKHFHGMYQFSAYFRISLRYWTILVI